MTEISDAEIRQRLQAWAPPAASPAAVDRILQAAQAQRPKPVVSPLRRVTWLAGPAVAAGLVAVMLSQGVGHRPALSDPLLQQDALNTFDMRAPSADLTQDLEQ